MQLRELELELAWRVLSPMEHSFSIAGFSDLVGLVSVVVSIVAVGVMLQRMKGPGNREPLA